MPTTQSQLFVVLLFISVLSVPVNLLAGPSPVVRFDMAPIAAAASSESDPNVVTIQFRLSSMIESPEKEKIDQWIVRLQPRDQGAELVDYSPRTETASDLVSPIQVKESAEQSNALGLTADTSYGHLARGKFGADRSTKNINTQQFDRVAPVQAVTASGTINRGRGVYFKLRWTALQVLEGEKNFSLTLRVPPSWRGGLIDVSVVAQSERKSIGGWERESKVLGEDNFVIAAHRQGDRQAEALARALSDAEYELRSIATQQRKATSATSLPGMLRQVAIKLDLEDEVANDGWLERLLRNQADPHFDKEISKMSMPIRVAVLDYVDIRNEFRTLAETSAVRDEMSRVLVAKPAQ
jgi:hypothetical protein